MKLLIAFLFLATTSAVSPKSIYEISFPSVDGTVIKMSDFKGKKILVAAVSPDNLYSGRLSFLDSLQTAFPSIAIIAIPASDFGGTKNTEIISAVKSNLSKKILVAAMSPVKKEAGSRQNTLLQWLTSDAGNAHFDADVATDEQLYVISESGILYAILEKGSPIKVLETILKQQDVKQ